MTEIELTGLNEVLDLIDSYFDDRADADQEPGDAYPIGNEEMGLLTQLRRERARLSVSATPNRTGGVGAEPAPVAYRYRDRANGPNERWIYVEMLDGREGFVLKSVLNRPEEYEAVPLYASPAIPADHVVRDAALEEAVKAGYDACRKSIYAVCEDMQAQADALRIKGPIGSHSQEQHSKGYHAGTNFAAKSIARTFNSLGHDDDNLAEAIRALKSVPASPPVGDDDAVDAARWRALMSSQKMHWMGSAGFEHRTLDYAKAGSKLTEDQDPLPRPGEPWHFGMEFWFGVPADPRYPDTFERRLMVNYVDAIRSALIAPPSTEGDGK